MIVTLPRYVLREATKVFLVATTAVTGVIFITFCVRLLNRGLNVVQLRGAAPYMALFALPFAAPCALLIAAVLTFGRLAGDNELTATRAHGINPWRLVFPVLGLGLVLSLVCLYLNGTLLPAMQGRLRAAGRQALAPFLERLGTWSMEMELPPYVVYVGGKNPGQASSWRSVAVARYANNIIADIYLAERGAYQVDEAAEHANITLESVYLLRPAPDGATETEGWAYFGRVALPINLTEADKSGSPSLSALSWGPLREQYRALRERTAGQKPVSNPRGERSKAQKEVTRLQNQLKDLTRDQETLGKQATEARLARERLAAQVAGLGVTVRRLEENIHARAIEEATDKEEIQRRETWLKEEKNPERAQALRARLDELRRRLTEVTRDLGQARKELAQANDRLAAVRPELAKEKETAESVTARAKAAEEDLAGRQEQLDAAREVYARADDQVDLLDITTIIHYRLSQSLAAFVFVLVGVPLGMLIHRGSAVIAFGASLGVILVLYYPLYNLGRMLAANAYLPPGPALWLAPAACAVVGLALFAAAMRR